MTISELRRILGQLQLRHGDIEVTAAGRPIEAIEVQPVAAAGQRPSARRRGQAFSCSIQPSGK